MIILLFYFKLLKWLPFSRLLNNLSIGWVALIAGGYNGGALPYVELFSPNGKCNQALPNLPTPLYGHTLGTYMGRVFSCMGYSPAYGNTVNCWEYSIASNTWSLMTSSRYAHTFMNGQIYKNQIYFPDYSYPETYNLDTNSWSSGIYIPNSPGSNPCIVSYLDTFIAIGGTSYPTGMQQYNFTSKTWTNLPSLSPGYSYFGCTLLPAPSDAPISAPLFTNRILMMQSQASDVLGTMFDISSSQFLPISPTTYGHRHNQILSLGRRVFVFAGFNGAPNNLVEEYHQHNNSWTVVPSGLLNGRFHTGAVAVPAHWFKNIPGGCQGVI